MQVIKLEVGNLGTNCYIVWCEQTHKAIVIDPGADAERILAAIRAKQLTVEYIVNTHGHADHIGALTTIKEATGAPVLIHSADAAMLTSGTKNLSVFLGAELLCPPPDQLLKASDTIIAGTVKLTVRETPGHTLGGICLIGDGIVFSGDTLFAESIGRSDFPGGSHKQLIASIINELMILPDEWVVYPGHGADTTIGWERQHNPFLR